MKYLNLLLLSVALPVLAAKPEAPVQVEVAIAESAVKESWVPFLDADKKASKRDVLALEAQADVLSEKLEKDLDALISAKLDALLSND